MERTEESKRIRLSEAAFVSAMELRELGAGSLAAHQEEGDGIGQEREVNQTVQGLAVEEMRAVEDRRGLSGNGNGVEGGVGKMGSLDADLLVKVLSHLSQQNRCQSMLVNKHREKTVRESSACGGD